MKKIGMIGGFSPESTLDYYRLLIETHNKQATSKKNPEIIIYSMDINILFSFINNKQWNELVGWLSDGIEVLSKAGADFGFISANTPHVVFDKINELSNIPLISIVEETCNYSKNLGLRKLGLFGTKSTMQNDFFSKVFNEKDMDIIVPNEKEQDYIHNKLITEIQLGNFLDETRVKLIGIAKRMIDENSIDGLILGCTELPLILTKDELGIPFLNTTKIHVESIIKYYLDEK
jgi:aspartate racemase